MGCWLVGTTANLLHFLTAMIRGSTQKHVHTSREKKLLILWRREGKLLVYQWLTVVISSNLAVDIVGVLIAGQEAMIGGPPKQRK